MQYGDSRRPGETMNDYCCRVDDEVRPHETRDSRILLGLALLSAIVMIAGCVAWLG